ncbi:hypothetical protein AJ79_00184 [Helicocarpus griseus UAMH5409]|uniref:Uncharacterized protein n=1 Tax=Helicocarpus griseus UAMH5409 TaxID=1447875 RepID=A0A2B7YCI2_9EURO|nr:hypothetical protein AJ79_00184 [Helicocarpus griseus UAMH5409]
MTFHDIDIGHNSKQPSSPALEVTDYFGPQALTGEKREVNVTNAIEANPKVGGMHGTLEGFGASKTSRATYAARWKFSGERFASAASGAKEGSSLGSQYRELVWHLEENELEKQAVHSSISAKLRKLRHRFLKRLQCPPPEKMAHTRARIEPGIGGTQMTGKDFPHAVRNINGITTKMNLHPVVDGEVPNDTNLLKLEDIPQRAAMAGQLSGGQYQTTVIVSQTNTDGHHSPKPATAPPPYSAPAKAPSSPASTLQAKRLTDTLTASTQLSQVLVIVLGSLIASLTRVHDTFNQSRKVID